MAKKSKDKKEKSSPFRLISRLSEELGEETKHGVWGIVFLVLSIFLVLSMSGRGGMAGNASYDFLIKGLGAGFFILPLSFFMIAISLFKSKRPRIVSIHAIGGTLFFFSLLALLEIFLQEQGGALGRVIAFPFLKLFGIYASVLFLVALVLISLLVIFDTKLTFPRLFRRKTDDAAKAEEVTVSGIEEKEEKVQEKEIRAAAPLYTGAAPSEQKTRKQDEEEEFSFSKISGEYTPPPLSLLEKDRGTPDHGDIRARANIIKRTLLNFGIEVELGDISVGPTFTRYSIKPAEGVRLSRIVALQNDLGLALAAHPVRIEAPIPGKSLVGIEVPNASKSIVGLATLLSQDEFVSSNAPLLLALGRNVSGAPFFANLARAPHMLVAGATGAGKSVTIHSFIASLLYRNSPDLLRFIMIDPKRVELTGYNGIPHLLTPVITDPKKAIRALKWAINQMEERYNILETERVRDIQTYHKEIFLPELEKALKKGVSAEDELPISMPYIVIIIDELADIMARFPKELEAAIVRIAQMSRAVGIHLILSTQRPSVDVITGIIKANIPSRVALQVSSQIDSRTILDATGAEKLIGAGDMLYLSGEMSKPVRLQSAFVSENEVKKIVKYLSKQYPNGFQEEDPLLPQNEEGNTLAMNLDEDQKEEVDFDDPFYEAAKAIVLRDRKASASYLQRRLSIGYNRAARILDIMEARGVVGPGDGAKARVIFEKTENAPTTDPEEHENSSEEEILKETQP